MARKNRNEILVGGFVSVALGLLVLLFFLKGALGELFAQVGKVQVIFEDIRGLRQGDPVFFLGSKVGRVSAVSFDRRRWAEEVPGLFPGEKGETSRVRITLQVEEPALKLLRAGCVVDIDKNLTGNLSVLIHDGPGPLLPSSGAVLRGSPGTELAAIADRVDGLLKKLDPAVEDFASLAHRLSQSGNLESMVKDLANLARQLQEGFGPIQSKLDGALSEARQILTENRSDLRLATQNLAEGLGLARKVLEKVEPATKDLQGALAQLEKAGASVTRAIESNRPGLDAIVEDAKTAIANASNLTADIRRRPWRLLYRPSKEEVEALELYDAAWAYNLGASDLERSLRDLAVRLEASPAQGQSPDAVRVAYQKVEESLRRHKEAEEAFWARLKGR